MSNIALIVNNVLSNSGVTLASKADLVNGLVPANQLPSYVDDVLEFANLAAFPATGESAKIYVALDTNETYRWSGSAYIRIANGAVQSINSQTGNVTLTTSNIGEGSNLYYTDARVRAAISVSGSLSYNSTTGVISYTQPINVSAFTNDAAYITTAGARSAISLTTTGTSGAASYDSSTGVLNIPQYQSVLTNPITGTGSANQVAYWNGTNTQTGSSTFVFSPTTQLSLSNSVTASGAIARGARFIPTLTAAANNDVLVGLEINPTFTVGAFTGVSSFAIRSLGSGVTELRGGVTIGINQGDMGYVNLRISKNLTGSVAIGISNSGQAQTDVGSVRNYASSSWLAASTALTTYNHYFAEQGTWGAGSSVTTQIGYNATSGLIGATNNYGFRGQIPSGTGRWNLYMDGTAINYLNGALLIGVTNHNTVDKLQITGSASVTSSITAGSFVKSGGTSSQFLKADGSVDASVYIVGITSSMVTTALGYTPYNSSNPAGYISSYTETDTLASVTARGASTSTNITLSGTGNQFSGHHYFLPWDSDGNHYPHYNIGGNNNGSKLNLRMFGGNGSITRVFYLNGNTGAISWDGNTIWHAGNLTNLNQLSNGPGYITGYTETDTLASVTARGASTSTAVTFNGNVNANGTYFNVAGYIDLSGLLYLRSNVNYLNASSNGWNTFLARNGEGFDAYVSRVFSSSHISSTGGNLHTNRGRVAFSSTAGDANHSIYNNYNNIDGEGVWDGMKMNVYNGLDVRTGNASGAVPTTVFQIRSSSVNSLVALQQSGNQVLHAGNYNSYALPLTGGTLTGQLTITGARLLLETGGSNTYGIVSGYNNNNHLMTMRGQITGSTSSPTITGAHQMTFVEYADAGDTSGWYFKSSNTGTYEEIAKITRTGIKWGGNLVLHAGNYNSYSPTLTGGNASGTWGINITGNANYASSAGNADTVDSLHADTFYRNLGFGSGYPSWDLNTVAEDRSGFTYSNNAPWTGPFLYVGASGYGLQLNANYGDGTGLSYRVRNGDNATWQAWRRIVWEGGTWSMSITGNAATVSSITGNTGLMVNRLTPSAFIDGLTTSNFRSTLFGTSANGAAISAGRWNSTPAPLSGMNNYSTMIAWSGDSDTHGFLAIDYASAGARVGGGYGNNITWVATLLNSSNYSSYNSYSTLTLSSTLNLPNAALISVNGEPDVWGARFRTTTSTTNLGAALKNIIWTGGGANEGFAVTGSGTGGASFEVRNDGRAWFKGDLTAQSNMYVLADGSSGYVASRIWLYSHNNYRGAGIYMSGTGNTWFAGTPYTDFAGVYVIARTNTAGDDASAQVGNRRWQVDSSGNTYQIGDLSAVNIHAYAATGKVVAGTWNFDGMLFDSSRSALIARGNYPHIELWSDVSNANHGGTLRFGGYDNGSSGAYKSWNIGAPGSDLYFLDIGYGANNANPHAGIAGLGAAYSYPGAFTIMRFHNNGNIGIGNFGTYGSEGNTPSYKLDVRGTGRFTSTLYANSTIEVASGGNAINIAGAQGKITFRDQDLTWTGYVGFSGNIGILEFPGRNVRITSGYNGTVEINTGTNDYLSGRLTVPYGSVNAKRGFTSEGNPWGTADSAYFPNGVTTAGSTNWLYGLCYLGNAPSNGSGAEVASNGRSYFRSSNTSGTWGYAGQFVDRNSAANNYVPWSFESEYGNHSWGIVARFHIQSSGQDKPAIQFTAAGSNERWSIGYCTGSDFNFRITQNQGYRTDNSTNDGWGTERFRINTDGATYCFSSFTASGDITAYSDIRVKENIVEISDPIQKVKAIRGVTFTRNDADDKDKRHTGVIAQEVMQVLPEVVSTTDKGLHTVAYGNMVGLLVEAIKEQQTHIDAQKSEIEELKELVKQLINK